MASREKASKNRGVTFTPDSAKAIAETVRTVQGGNRGQSGIKGSGSAYASPHYLSKTTATWTKGTSQSLTLYVGEPGSEAAESGETVEAWNYVGTLPSGIWVVLARANATFYLASFDFTGLPNYSASKQQVLGHAANGGIAWIDTTACT
jgi:hypothetical protein